MNKDYKHVTSRELGAQDAASRTPAHKSRWIFLSGLIPGLVLAAAVHVYHLSQPAPTPSPGAWVNQPEQSSTTEKQAEKHEYEFFTILPELEIIVPEYSETDPAQRPTYVLQAGSFRLQRTAESLQSKLKTFDLESEVQRVESGDGSVWYRVRLGPYDSLSRVNNIKLDLRKQGIESLLKKH